MDLKNYFFSVCIRDEIKPVQAIKILKVLKKDERVENFEKKACYLV
jgi:hypothetical protein